MLIPNCNFLTDAYGGADLINVFPITKFYYFHLTGDNGFTTVIQSISPPPNYTGTDYAVFPSIYFGYAGSTSGTYGLQGSVHAINNPIVISNQLNDRFSWSISKSTGNNVNIYIIFMVVWNSSLNYPPSYG